MRQLLLVVATVCAFASVATAQEDAAPPSREVNVTVDGAALPLSLPADRRYAALVTGYGGYNTAGAGASQFDVAAELKLYGPLFVRGGVSYISSGELKPSVGLSVQMLHQDQHGVSASLGVFYKPEGFDEPDGEIEAVFSIGRRIERVSLLLNVAYGQGAGSAERDAEVRGAVLVHAVGRLYAGVDSRFRFAIGDAKMGEPDWDLVAGPVASYAIAGFTISAQVGLSLISVASVQSSGVVMLGGLSRSF